MNSLFCISLLFRYGLPIPSTTMIRQNDVGQHSNSFAARVEYSYNSSFDELSQENHSYHSRLLSIVYLSVLS